MRRNESRFLIELNETHNFSFKNSSTFSLFSKFFVAGWEGLSRFCKVVV